MDASNPYPSTNPHTQPDDLEGIFRQLVKGLGHELVTEANVEALARLADQGGHAMLASELREWQAPC